MKTDVNDNEWQVYGRCCPKPNPSNPNPAPGTFKEGPITLPEQASKLGMRIRQPKPPTPPAKSSIPPASFGKPVTEELAIKLIHNGVSNTQYYFEYLLDDRNYEKENADPTLGTDQKDTLYKLLDLSYGITFDKTIILKILSQPNCEGLRAYLCMRPDGTKEAPNKHLSLVMVGVDADAYDLNYGPGDNPNKDAAVGANSLIGEYGFPPGGSKENNGKIDDHYALLKAAQ